MISIGAKSAAAVEVLAAVPAAMDVPQGRARRNNPAFRHIDDPAPDLLKLKLKLVKFHRSPRLRRRWIFTRELLKLPIPLLREFHIQLHKRPYPKRMGDRYPLLLVSKRLRLMMNATALTLLNPTIVM